MHVTRVAINEFRNFHELVLENLRPKSVVVGENNVGKSNFLHAVDWSSTPRFLTQLDS